MHEYLLTRDSLIAAAMPTDELLRYLDKFSKVVIPDSMRQMILQYTQAYGKVKVLSLSLRLSVSALAAKSVSGNHDAVGATTRPVFRRVRRCSCTTNTHER